MRVVLATGPPPWFWLQPAATMIAAGLALLGAALLVLSARASLAQKDSADRKLQWWQRTQWAVDKVLHDEPGVRELGYRMLDQQAGSALADTEDLALIDAVYDTDLDDALDIGSPEDDDGS